MYACDVIIMNHADALLQRPFCQLTNEEKCEVTLSTSNFSIVETGRTTNWFQKYKWRIAREDNPSLFCFYCLLSNTHSADPTWNKNGFKDLKHLSEKLKKHALPSVLVRTFNYVIRDAF